MNLELEKYIDMALVDGVIAESQGQTGNN